jgi:CRISPR-associated protein Cas2
MFIVVSYDVISDKRRNRISKLMLDYGTRVQRSVFECNLGPEQLKEMTERLLKVYDQKEDTIRVYFLCEGCVPKAHAYGVGELTKDEDVYVV